MGFFQAEVKNCLKITNFVDLIVNIVDGHRLKLLIFIRRVGNGLFKSVYNSSLSFIEKKL